MKRERRWVWIAVLVLFLGGLVGCDQETNPLNWVETYGQIGSIEAMDDGTYGFALIYDATGSTAVNTEGQPITGPITQYYLKKPNKPLSGQRVKLRYRRDEPVLYELLEAIQYVSE